MPKRGKSAAKGAKSKQATASEVEVTIESSELDAVVGEGLHGTEAPLDVGSDAENELNSCEDVGATSGEPNASWHSEDKADGSDGTHQAAAPAEVEVEAEGSAWNRARRESVYADKRGHLQSTSWCQEHYVRLPRPRHRTPSIFNLYGFMDLPAVQSCEIFFTRAMCVYDEFSDVLVALSIDSRRDPWWLAICLFLLIIPIMLKLLLVHQALRRKMGWGHFRLVLFGPFMLTLIDVYLLVCYPWVSPTDPDLFGTLERLSPLVETFVEGFGQSAFQLYMYARITSLPAGLGYETAGFEAVILSSCLPSIFNICYKIFQLSGDAKNVELGLCSYLQELVAGPLGYSAPFVTLLGKRHAVGYDTMGPLNALQLRQIGRCIGPNNTTLEELTFDDLNAVDPEVLAEPLAKNVTLRFVDFGLSKCDIMVMCKVFESTVNTEQLTIGLVGQVWPQVVRAKVCQEVKPLVQTVEDQFNNRPVREVDLAASDCLFDLSRHAETLGAELLLPRVLPGLVLWLDASCEGTLLRNNSDGGLLAWRSKFRGPGLETHYLLSESKSPTVEFHGGKPSVQFSKFRSMEMKYPLEKIGTIISVHAFEKITDARHTKQFYLFTGQEQGPFHGDEWSEGALISGHGSWVHPSPKSGMYRLNGGAWEEVGKRRQNPYWTEMQVASFKCGESFKLRPGWANRIGMDRKDIHQFKGCISEVLVFDDILADADIEHVEDYLLKKWLPEVERPARVAGDIPAGPAKSRGQRLLAAAFQTTHRFLRSRDTVIDTE
ncbi:unnamed protein product [Durusdinium trenchii]|uniref:Uncharacterized protein n=1 Tax=Durusdinium trenchii TaxID=1381693 RepID=A0ABP0HD01_9DINO